MSIASNTMMATVVSIEDSTSEWATTDVVPDESLLWSQISVPVTPGPDRLLELALTACSPALSPRYRADVLTAHGVDGAHREVEWQVGHQAMLAHIGAGDPPIYIIPDRHRMTCSALNRLTTPRDTPADKPSTETVKPQTKRAGKPRPRVNKEAPHV